MQQLDREQLATGAEAFGIRLDEMALDRFTRFSRLLEETNRTMNLTRIPPEETVTKHFLDSLALAAVWKPQVGDRLMDVGTGAGFPGLPLALAFPELQVMLLDSTGKRLAFIDSVLRELNVTNAKTLLGRAEDIARKPLHRHQYTIATARAVAPLEKLAGWLLPFLRPGGLAVAYKSVNVSEEIREARAGIARIGGKVRVAEIALPLTDIVRHLVLIENVILPFHRENERQSR